nr:hypothetical protein B24P11.220 [imported] - Neurospora crassa [Neurospora crassa]
MRSVATCPAALNEGMMLRRRITRYEGSWRMRLERNSRIQGGGTRNAADLDGLAGTSIEASDPTDVDNEVVLRERGTGRLSGWIDNKRTHINGSFDGAQQKLERGARLRRKRRGGPVGTQRLPDLPVYLRPHLGGKGRGPELQTFLPCSRPVVSTQRQARSASDNKVGVEIGIAGYGDLEGAPPDTWALRGRCPLYKGWDAIRYLALASMCPDSSRRAALDFLFFKKDKKSDEVAVMLWHTEPTIAERDQKRWIDLSAVSAAHHHEARTNDTQPGYAGTESALMWVSHRKIRAQVHAAGSAETNSGSGWHGGESLCIGCGQVVTKFAAVPWSYPTYTGSLGRTAQFNSDAVERTRPDDTCDILRKRLESQLGMRHTCKAA